jgi:hypothetical protein
MLLCAGTARGQERPTLEACRAYVALAPLDAGVMKLLSTPAMPPTTIVFASQDIRRINQWDFPPKVTAWEERPPATELAQEWEELNRSWHGVKPGDTAKNVAPAVYRPYELLNVSPRDWQELRKWMMKETGKQVPGACFDEGKATYLFLAGAVRDATAAAGGGNPLRTLQYSQTAGQPQSEGSGPGSHPGNSAGHNSVADEFAAASSSNDPSVYACAYLYPTQGTTRQPVPEYYYCHAASSLKSSLSTMLKFVSKQGLP